MQQTKDAVNRHFANFFYFTLICCADNSLHEVSLRRLFILVRVCSYGGELARLGGLPHLGEMIFILRSYAIFYLSSIKKFVMLLEKDYLIK